MTCRRCYPLLAVSCSVALGVLLLFWMVIALYWAANCVRGGRESAEAWLMHVALLGVPFENRSVAETVRRIHSTYESLILLLLFTFLLHIGRSFFKARSGQVQQSDNERQPNPSGPLVDPPRGR
jgi:hypothetical protein